MMEQQSPISNHQFGIAKLIMKTTRCDVEKASKVEIVFPAFIKGVAHSEIAFDFVSNLVE